MGGIGVEGNVMQGEQHKRRTDGEGDRMGPGNRWWERYEKEKNEKKSDSVFTSGSPNHSNPVFYHRIDNWNYPKVLGVNSSFRLRRPTLKYYREVPAARPEMAKVRAVQP
ncbi:MAG: hypothetical protein ACLTBV_17105 [Enterocloster bolteae]